MSGILSTIISSSAYNIFNKIFYQRKERNMIIEPMSCIIKLSILQFYPEGTKISIHDNEIIFDEPGIFQGVYRNIYGDNRDDLHNLHNPISKALQWYNDIDDISTLYMSTIDGITTLKKNYPERSIVSDALNSYIKLIQRGLIKLNKKGKHKIDSIEQNLYEHLSDDERKYIETLDSSVTGKRVNLSRKSENIVNSPNTSTNTASKDTETVIRNDNEIHDFVKGLWSITEIKIIIQLIKELKNNNKTNVLNTICTLVKVKESKLHEFIQNHSSVL